MATAEEQAKDLDVVSEIFFDADGNVVTDPSTAASGEVVIRHDDGSLEHVQLLDPSKAKK